MLTVDDARSAFDRYCAEHPLLVEGTMHVDGWYEDDDDFLPVWGAREFYVDHDPSYGRWDSMVVFVDRRSGAVRQGFRWDHAEKLDGMRPVTSG